MRRADRLVALILGVAIAAAAVVGGVEAVLLDMGRPALLVPRSRWGTALRSLRWGDGTLQTVAGVMVGVGVVVVLAQLWPRRPLRFRLHRGPSAGIWVSRKGLARRLAARAAALPEVAAASASIGRRRLRVQVRMAAGTEPGEGQRRVRDVLTGELDAWELDRPLRVRLRAVPAKAPKAPAGGAA